MFITAQQIQAETAYKQERTKREFGGSRRARRATQPESRHARRAGRYTTAA